MLRSIFSVILFLFRAYSVSSKASTSLLNDLVTDAIFFMASEYRSVALTTMDASGMISPPLLDSFSQSWYKENEVNAMKWNEAPRGIKGLLLYISILGAASLAFLVWMSA